MTRTPLLYHNTYQQKQPKLIMQNDILFFDNFAAPFRAAIGLFLTLITLPGFFTSEKIRNEQRKKTELAKKQGREPTLYVPHSVFPLLTIYSFNFLIITFAFAGNLKLPYLLATTWLSFVPQLVIPLLIKTNLNMLLDFVDVLLLLEYAAPCTIHFKWKHQAKAQIGSCASFPCAALQWRLGALADLAVMQDGQHILSMESLQR